MTGTMNLKEMDRAKGYLRTVECVADYIFNKTDTFPGVQFIKGMTYEANICDSKKWNLYSVYKDNVPIGMSIITFNRHFKFKED